jgi:tetratricopeptide (TPR) repeat protein
VARVQLFLSTVSAEFLSYRERLCHRLTRPDVEVMVQEDFIVTGDETLEMLDRYIQGCDGVIHLVGDMTGSMAKPQSVAAIASRYPEMGSRFPLAEFLQPDGPSLSYTQWEAWLALWHGKRLFIATPSDGAPRDEKYRCEPEQQDLQRSHLARLRDVARYPGTVFGGQEQLVAEVSVSFVLDLLVRAGLTRQPLTLPFASIGSLFKGRGALIELLENATRPLALVGLGGVGKTRLAIEHAWRQIGRCNAVLLVSAGSAEALNRNLAGLCNPTALDLPGQTLTEEAAQRQAALHWLQANPGWLLILDNVDTPEAAAEVETLLPQLSGGQLVLTTRLRNWSAAVQLQEVEVLTPEDATAFLLERTAERRRQAADDASVARAMAVDDLGGLALALEQAGAFINQRRLSLSDYRSQWQTNRQVVLAWNDPRLMQYDRSLLTTWFTSYQQVGEAACGLLRRLAWLSPEPIPESLLEVKLPDDTLAGKDQWEALCELEGYSLVIRSAKASMFSVHRIVQQVARLWQQQPNNLHPNELNQALDWINTAFVEDPKDVRSWPFLGSLAPHAKTVSSFADKAGIAEPTLKLITRLAGLLAEKAVYSDAEPLMRLALAIAEASYGSEHPNVAAALSNLALLLKTTGRLAETEPLMRRALLISEKNYGGNHQMVAICLSNLAEFLGKTNRLAEAEPLMRRALIIDEATYGSEHPSVATSLNNLAEILIMSGRLEEGERLQRKALTIIENSHGSSDPRVAPYLHNIAVLLLATSRLVEAESMIRKELKIVESAYGTEHPRTADALESLSLLLFTGKSLTEAEEMLCRALDIYNKIYSANHPCISHACYNLAQVLIRSGKVIEAESLMRQSIEMVMATYEHGLQATVLQERLSGYVDFLSNLGLSMGEIADKIQSLRPRF